MATPETIELFERSREQRARMITLGVVAHEQYLEIPFVERSGYPEADKHYVEAHRELHLLRHVLDNPHPDSNN